MNHWKFSMKSDPGELRALRESLASFLTKTSLSEEDREKIQVVMGEACTNAIRHSYGNEKGHEIRVEAEELPDKVVIKLRDWGKKIDPAKTCCKPKLPPETAGGLGIYFIQTMMDEVCYNTQHEKGNELILIKHKGPAQ